MNGDHQLLAAAPLDLRTTNRDHGTLNCKGRVRDAPPLAESGASRISSADRPSSRLPFRKRPIHLELGTETQPVTPEPTGHRVSPAEESTCRRSVAGQSAAESRVFPESVIPFRNGGPIRYLKLTDYVTSPYYGKHSQSKDFFWKNYFFLICFNFPSEDLLKSFKRSKAFQET